MVIYGAAVVAAYLVGAIPFGFLLVKMLKGEDIRKTGSGNIGATNVARAAGARVGFLALLLDVAKGFAASTAIPLWAFSRAHEVQAATTSELVRQAFATPAYVWLAMGCGLAAIVGHVWPIYLSFKGGKGVATSLGVLLGLAPWPTLGALFLWALVTRISGYVSVGSIAAAVALPAIYAVLHAGTLGRDWHLLAFMLLVSAIVIVRHRTNIRRLREGTEYRLAFRRRRGSGAAARAGPSKAGLRLKAQELKEDKGRCDAPYGASSTGDMMFAPKAREKKAIANGAG